jgi:competence protein ComFC
MLYFLFPKECLVCFKTGSWLCDKCQKKLVTTLPNCYICKKLSNGYMTHQSCKKTNSLQQVITLWKYNEYSKKLIHNFKYKNRVKVGEFIFSLFEEKLKNIESKGTLLVPLPSHKSKTLERGFNPTEILSVLIAQRIGLEINNRLIIKKKRNVAQASLKYEQRVENVKNIFEINLNEIQILKKYNQILIVDDIITTGATLDEISCEILSNLEFKIEVKALCIFQGSFRKNEHKKSLQSGK